MDTLPPDAIEESILVLAPVGRDAELAAAVLSGAGLHPEVCATLGEVIQKLGQGRGAVLMAEEALVPDGHEWVRMMDPRSAGGEDRAGFGGLSRL